MTTVTPAPATGAHRITRPALPAPVRLVIDLMVGALAVATIGLLCLMVVIPMVMHWVPLTILSGSMEPTIPVGSQVVVERITSEQEVAQLQKGDVITFMPKPNDTRLVTHRITSISVDGHGVHSVRTKGDANRSEDPETKTVKQIRGKVVYHLPKVGYLAMALNQDQKSKGIIVVAGALFTYAAYEVVRALQRSRVIDREEVL